MRDYLAWVALKLGDLRNQLVQGPWFSRHLGGFCLFTSATAVRNVRGRESGRAEEAEDTPRLEEVASCALAGRVESLTVLKSRVPGLQRDALLLTFR